MSTQQSNLLSQEDELILQIRQVKEELKSTLSIPELTKKLKFFSSNKVILKGEHENERCHQQNDCLKKSLQAAVTLEFATIPPYLTALWSIKDELHSVTQSIREVVQEEMLHMALACNMLASLGEEPQIATTVPKYPGALPGGVHKGLEVTLTGLNKQSLSTFLWIERPLEQVPIDNPYNERPQNDFNLSNIDKDHPQDETIGAFYEEIRKAFFAYLQNKDNPRLTTENQVSGPLAWTVISNMDDVNFAINRIIEQGEGSHNNPEDTKGDLSHYYRFLEVYNGKKYQWSAKEKKLIVLDDLPFPDVHPVAAVPAGGYLQADVSPDVWHHMDKFDKTYSKLLDALQSAWTVGGQAELVCAYSIMFDLEQSAKPLMQTKLPFGGGKTYAPSWRYICQ